jgi:N-acetylglucosamine kinase-like BadF-type ATPase
MSNPGSEHAAGDTKVPHEQAVDQAVDAQLERTSDEPYIAAAASPSASYVQAEAVAVRNVANACRQVLIDAGLMPSS